MKNKQFDVYYFKRQTKKNMFIAMTMFDSEKNVFKIDSDTGDKTFAVDIEEFKTRISEVAYGCEVITSEEFIVANDMKPFTHKTTIVLCENPRHFGSTIEYKYRRNMKFIPKRDFIKFVETHETRRKSPLFFILNEELEKISPCIDVFEFAVSDRIVAEDKLATFERCHNYFEHLKRKTIINTDLSTKYDKMQKTKEDSDDGKLKRTVLNGSMTIIEKVEVENLLGYKYHFERYE